MKSLLLQNQREFDTALRSKDAFRSSLERQLQEQHVQMRALEADSERLTEVSACLSVVHADHSVTGSDVDVEHIIDSCAIAAVSISVFVAWSQSTPVP